MIRPMTSNVSALSGCVANGHQAVHRVSFCPSKIPYGGFSPVRLQTGLGPSPSPTGTHPAAYRRSMPRSSAAAIAPEGAVAVLSRRRAAIFRDRPVQRPLARRRKAAPSVRVVLSRRVIAYYGLIRGSRSLPAAYVLRRRAFASRPALGSPLRPRSGDSLLCSACPSVRAVCRTPADRAVFAVSISARDSLRPSVTGSASASPTQKSVHAWPCFRGCTVRFMLRPGPLLALHRHRTFTFELSSHEFTSQWNVEYDYTAKSAIAVAGLSPAGQTALQAATRISRIARMG